VIEVARLTIDGALVAWALAALIGDGRVLPGVAHFPDPFGAGLLDARTRSRIG
jgi:hypothetical protein